MQQKYKRLAMRLFDRSIRKVSHNAFWLNHRRLRFEGDINWQAEKTVWCWNQNDVSMHSWIESREHWTLNIERPRLNETGKGIAKRML